MDAKTTSRIDRLLRPRVDRDRRRVAGAWPSGQHRARQSGALPLRWRDPSGQPLAQRVQRPPVRAEHRRAAVRRRCRRAGRSAGGGDRRDRGAGPARRRRGDRVRRRLCRGRRCGPRRAGEADRRGARRKRRGARAELHRHVQLRCRRGAHLRVQRRAPGDKRAPEDRHGGAERRHGGDHAHGVPVQGPRHHVLHLDRKRSRSWRRGFSERAGRRSGNESHRAVRRAGPQAAAVPGGGAPRPRGGKAGRVAARRPQPARAGFGPLAHRRARGRLCDHHGAVAPCRRECGRDDGRAGRRHRSAGALQAAGEGARHHHQFGRRERLRARFFRFDRLRRAAACAGHRRRAQGASCPATRRSRTPWTSPRMCCAT